MVQICGGGKVKKPAFQGAGQGRGPGTGRSMMVTYPAQAVTVVVIQQPESLRSGGDSVSDEAANNYGNEPKDGGVAEHQVQCPSGRDKADTGGQNSETHVRAPIKQSRPEASQEADAGAEERKFEATHQKKAVHQACAHAGTKQGTDNAKKHVIGCYNGLART